MPLYKCKQSKKYYLLDYIKSTSYQAINTGFVPSEHLPFTIRNSFSLQSQSSDSEYTVWGSIDSNGQRLYLTHINYHWRGTRATTTNNFGSFSLNSTNTEVTTCSSSSTTFNVNSSASTVSSSSISTVPLYIFARNNKRDGGVDRYSSMTLYSFSIDNYLDLVPVQEKSTGLNGLYDKITKTFFPSVTSTNFIAGNIIGEI
jgi:hypothetical protein